jgi:3-deoxy-manno-octulosonate cytidylyltransferase (CMP-KDO synthetase)
LRQTPPRFAIIIPARFDSTRLPGKPLVSLRGATGLEKPLIRRTWEAANSIENHSGIWIATDDPRIAETVDAFGGQVVLTSNQCRNGTERCAEAMSILGDVADIVINLQGDAPLTPSHIIPELVNALEEDASAAMATPTITCSPSLYAHLANDEANGRVGGTTVVASKSDRALYFSKRILPHIPPNMDHRAHEAILLHLGIYAYRPEALAIYAAMQPSMLEELEGLEQLRFLDGDLPVRCVRFAPLEWDCIELNNQQDIPAIEAILLSRGII